MLNAPVFPLFAWLLPLAALPIIFHLFFRMKKRPQPFPSLMFFHRIDPKLSARQKIMEWLILALRTLMILFLLLALAKFVWYGAGARGSVARVVVLDNSGSMSARFKGEQTKLRAAVDAAQALISNLKHKDDAAAVVLLVDDPTVPLPAGLVTDRASLKSAVSQVKETEASGSAAAALERALSLIENSTATRYEVHILSDLQEAEWNRLSSLRTPRAGTLIMVHRLGTALDKEANVSLASVRLPGRKALAGRKIPVDVDLSNRQDVDARGRLNWADDQGNRNTVEVVVPARADKSVTLLLEPQNPGLHWVNVWYEGDRFLADNRASLAFVVAEKRAVLFGGKKDDFGLLPVALSPTLDGRLSGLAPEFVDPSSLVVSLADKRPVFVVLPWDALIGRASEETALRQYVEQGGNLMIVPRVNDSQVASRPPDWLGAVPETQESSESGVQVLSFRPNAPVFTDLRTARGDLLLRNIKAFKYVPLKLSEQTQGLLGLEDGRVLLAWRGMGRGNIFLSGVAFDPQWSTLPLKGGCLALVQNMALMGEEATDVLVGLTAGERLPTVPEDLRELEIRTVTGSGLEWKGEAGKRPEFPRSGVYTVQGGKRAWCVYVRGAEREGVWRFVSGDKIPALGGLRCQLRDFTSADDVGEEARRMQASLDLFLPFLLLALACCLMEGWLSSQPPRKPRAAETTGGFSRPEEKAEAVAGKS